MVTTVTAMVVSVPLSSNLVIEDVKLLGQGAVHVEPPVADKELLVEQAAVGAEEAVLSEATVAVAAADVESLAIGLGVSIVSALDLAVTKEGCVRNLGIDWIIHSGNSRNVLLKIAPSCKVRSAALIKASAFSKPSCT